MSSFHKLIYHIQNQLLQGSIPADSQGAGQHPFSSDIVHADLEPSGSCFHGAEFPARSVRVRRLYAAVLESGHRLQEIR